MSWLGTRILDLFVRRADGAVATAEREDAELPQKRGHAGAALMLLVPDAAGRSYFRSYTFEDAEAAAGFIDFWYPADSKPPLAAFWALHDRPEAAPDAEVAVVIRDPGKPGTVHVFSFLELELAHSFIRVAAAEGTDLGLFQLYWAVPIKVAIDKWRSVAIVPHEPPPVAREASLTFAAVPSARTAPPVEQRPRWQPPAERGAPVEPARRGQGAETLPVTQEKDAEGHHSEVTRAAPSHEPPAEDESPWEPPAASHQAPVKRNGRSKAPRAWPEPAEEEGVSPEPVEAPDGVTSEGPVNSDNGHSAAAVTQAATGSTLEAESPRETVVAQPETAAAAEPEPPAAPEVVWEPPATPEGQETGPEETATIEPAPADQQDAGDRQLEATDEPNAAGELEGLLRDLSKALRVKRWESKEGPFQGFGSPPGKF